MVKKDNYNFISEPVFLVGAERSGTTVLRLMLDHHPQIAFNNEFEYAVDLVSDEGKWPEMDRYYEWLETNRIFLGSGFEIDRSLSYPELIDSFLRQKRDRAGKPFVGATVHRHFNWLLDIWPDARFIHILRDGRDVARSNIGMGWAGNVWTGVNRWVEAEQLWTKLKEIIPENRRTELTYENLISEPVLVLTQLCEFIGVPYNEAMLSYPETSPYELPDKKYVAQWKIKMSEYEIRLVESKAGNMLEERGYELSGLPILIVNSTTKLRLKFQDKLERIKYRVNRLGLGLYIEDYLSRHLGSEKWEKAVKLKIVNMQQAGMRKNVERKMKEKGKSQ
ncbi:MAG: sulfotransferase [Microcoleaceae cyanobacterium MO_207.B10]|nr:sulfotransferase [Microcoleaceae cyanobacterium MO_207.B10]